MGPDWLERCQLELSTGRLSRDLQYDVQLTNTSQEFGIGQGETEGAPNQIRDSWLVGLVNAGPYIGR